MPPQPIPLDRRTGAYRYHSVNFEDAGQNSFDCPPGQNPADFELLHNVMPPVKGAFERRWGRSFFAEIGMGGVDRVYEYQAENDTTGYLILQPHTNRNAYRWKKDIDPTEALKLLFTASLGAGPLYETTAQGVAYMCNGVDTMKWWAEPKRNPLFDPAEAMGLPAPTTSPVVTAVTEAAEADYVLRPVVLKNGWGSGGHVGDYEGGENQGHTHPPDFGPSSSDSTAPYTNPTAVSDGNINSAATATFNHIHRYAGCVWKFQQTNKVTGAKLRVSSSVEDNLITGRSAGIWYSLDGGTTWELLYESNPDATRAKQWDEIVLPTDQVVNSVQVMAFLDAHDNMSHQVYDIQILLEESINPNAGKVDLEVGRRYFVVFKDGVTGHYSDLSPVSESTGPAQNSSFTISLPLAPANWPTISQKVLLATADGYDMETLYELAEVDRDVMTYVDNTSELDLLTKNVMAEVDEAGVEHGVVGNQPPPSDGTLIGTHAGRLVMVAKGNHRMRFSKSLSEVTTSTGKIAGVHQEAWPLDYELEVSVGPERISAWISDGSNIWIGTDRHIRRIAGTDVTNFFQPELAFNNVGVLNQETWQIVYLEGTPMGSMWLTPDYRVIGSDFNMYQNVGAPIQDVLNKINREFAHNAFATTFSSKAYNLYVLAIPTGTSEYCDTLCVFDLRRRRWFIWILPGEPVHSLTTWPDAFGVPQLLCGCGDGWMYRLDAEPDQTLRRDDTIVDMETVLTTVQNTVQKGALVGAFINTATGEVIQPVAIGLGATLICPNGANALQLGVNQNWSPTSPWTWTGIGGDPPVGSWLIKVEAPSGTTNVTVTDGSAPWIDDGNGSVNNITDFPFGGENPALPGLNSSAATPVAVPLVLAPGDEVVVTYLSGTITSALYTQTYDAAGAGPFLPGQEEGIDMNNDGHFPSYWMHGSYDTTVMRGQPATALIPVIIRTVWLDMQAPQTRKLLNELEVMTGDANLTVTVEAASTTAEFDTPTVVIQDAPLRSSPFGEFKLYLATRTNKDRFYRFTFKSLTGTGVTVLDSYSLEVVPFHNL